MIEFFLFKIVLGLILITLAGLFVTTYFMIGNTIVTKSIPMHLAYI